MTLTSRFFVSPVDLFMELHIGLVKNVLCTSTFEIVVLWRLLFVSVMDIGRGSCTIPPPTPLLLNYTQNELSPNFLWKFIMLLQNFLLHPSWGIMPLAFFPSVVASISPFRKSLIQYWLHNFKALYVNTWLLYVLIIVTELVVFSCRVYEESEAIWCKCRSIWEVW